MVERDIGGSGQIIGSLRNLRLSMSDSTFSPSPIFIKEQYSFWQSKDSHLTMDIYENIGLDVLGRADLTILFYFGLYYRLPTTQQVGFIGRSCVCWLILICCLRRHAIGICMLDLSFPPSYIAAYNTQGRYRQGCPCWRVDGAYGMLF